MTAAICDNCGRDRCPTRIRPSDASDDIDCMRFRAEAAEEGQKQHEEFEAKAAAGWKACIRERDALRAEVDAIRARAEAAEKERDEARSIGLENYERVRSERDAAWAAQWVEKIDRERA